MKPGSELGSEPLSLKQYFDISTEVFIELWQTPKNGGIITQGVKILRDNSKKRQQ
jgi:hypothetical protein